MNISFLQELIAMLVAVALIILLTAKFHVHAFFALTIACFVTGLGLGMPMADIIGNAKNGFGNIMKSLGLIIVLGTTLGVLLEQTGSTKAMCDYILRKVGEKNAALSMSLTGFVVGLPVFCDSGYIVLSGLNKSLSKKTGISIAITSISLATGLYAVHCLLPPHPGATAAASSIGADYGKLILYGVPIALPAMLVGHWWASFSGKKISSIEALQDELSKEGPTTPKPLKAFLPIIIPIALISISSFLKTATLMDSKWLKGLLSLGDPVLALAIGILLALTNKKKWDKTMLNHSLKESVEKAGGILVIIGAGGSFGAILASAQMGNHLGELFALEKLGIFFPFLISFLLKTAQGSSTVAILTAAPIIFPLLAPLGLGSDNGRILAVLSLGAGSMMVSHANDAYFWVISKFSGLDIKTMLKVYSIATILMGITTLIMVYIFSIFLL